MVRRVRRGAYCLWCKRALLSTDADSPLAFTKDHIYPRSLGGNQSRGKWYPCCRACNSVKADLTPEEWDRFREKHPRWWTLYPRTARQIGRFDGTN